MADTLQDFTASTFTHQGRTRPVYRKGSGPAVVVIHEVPGVTPRVADFGRRVAEAGLTAVLPSLFGTPGRAPSARYVASSLASACVSREFATWAMGSTSPVTVWLRALAREVHAECGGPGVGVVGMCLTGGFALAMMVDDEVVAPVLSQPSLPLGFGRKRRAGLHLSPQDRLAVKARADAGVCVMAARFTDDPLVPKRRFDAMKKLLGDNFIGIEIDSSKGNPYGIDHGAHSVLTEHLVDEPGHPTRDALDRVLDFLADRLLPAAG